MAIPILIIGQTGSGKSTSIENLPRDKTAILNADKKTLPFKKPEKFALYGNVSTTAQMINGMKAAEKNEKIEFIVIDTITHYASGPLYRERVKGVNGYTGWDNYKDHILDEIIEKIKNSSKKYIITAHETKTEDVSGMGLCCAKLQGQFKAGGFEEHMTIVFRAMVIDDIESDNGVVYKFATNRIPGERITAKTPRGMFENLYINNDVVEAYKMIDEYYK